MKVIEERPAIWPYVLVSLIIHALLFLLVPQLVPALPALAEKSIEVVPIVEEGPARQPMRIADIAEPKEQVRPKQAKFLGMYDSTVTQESVATVNRPGTSGEAKQKRPAPQKKTPPEPTLKNLMKGSGDRLLAFDRKLFEAKPPRVQSAIEKHPVSIGDGGSRNDFFPDFRRGAKTYLNVLRYPEVEYFVRMKRAFRMTFNPEPPLREYFSMNQVARGSIDVVLGVSVDRMGNLAELFVFRGSGIPSYDGEALRTVRASSPFAAPPSKFTDDDGMLRMSWTFTVYL